MIREAINWVKNVYATPSAEALALRELEDSKRMVGNGHGGRVVVWGLV